MAVARFVGGILERRLGDRGPPLALADLQVKNKNFEKKLESHIQDRSDQALHGFEAMSALTPITSALPPTADVIEACARLPLLTPSRRYGQTQGENAMGSLANLYKFRLAQILSGC